MEYKCKKIGETVNLECKFIPIRDEVGNVAQERKMLTDCNGCDIAGCPVGQLHRRPKNVQLCEFTAY